MSVYRRFSGLAGSSEGNGVMLGTTLAALTDYRGNELIAVSWNYSVFLLETSRRVHEVALC